MWATDALTFTCRDVAVQIGWNKPRGAKRPGREGDKLSIRTFAASTTRARDTARLCNQSSTHTRTPTHFDEVSVPAVRGAVVGSPLPVLLINLTGTMKAPVSPAPPAARSRRRLLLQPLRAPIFILDALACVRRYSPRGLPPNIVLNRAQRCAARESWSLAVRGSATWSSCLSVSLDLLGRKPKTEKTGIA